MVLYFTNTGVKAHILRRCIWHPDGTAEGPTRVKSTKRDALVQTVGIYGTDVHIAIQTVIQTVVIYGTDVQTVSI